MAIRFANVPPDHKAHWVVYKEEGPDHRDYPWFFEHRVVPTGNPRYEHDDREFEYGSFETWAEAFAAMLSASEYSCNPPIDSLVCMEVGQHVRSTRHTRWDCPFVTEVDTDRA